ncbi:MAG TPA: DegT/DnrJ/EryC1/StrS family aminotransferase, partial [Pyrinomonadaceae bacterium]|nr:DegT/DnrJ/EryC1/StrS family aminotransferase [Pyrinomonadaceae bacterium]
ARGYDEMLRGVEWLRTPLVPEGYVHGYQAYVCLFRPEKPSLNNVEQLNGRRNRLMTRLEELGISTRQGTHAAALVGYYSDKYGLTPEQFPNSYMAEQLSLTLPLYPQMTDAEQSLVCDSLMEAFDA